MLVYKSGNMRSLIIHVDYDYTYFTFIFRKFPKKTATVLISIQMVS
jgi:hypothetical protein